MYLALDTAAPRASLALGDEGGRVVAESSARIGGRRSEALLPALDALLSAAKLDPASISAVVVGGGPGSYTGVRIAAAAAKGVVHALGRPLYAHGSLEAMSAGVEAPERPLMPLLPARREEVYAACHRRADGRLLEIVPPELVSLESVIATAREHAAVAIGPGAETHARALRAASVLVDAALGGRRAAGLLRLHFWRGEAGRVADPWTWEPVYLRAAGPPSGDGDGEPTG
jgi:tRNA threonylcarbamoyladenosine biosynthesis protein TsaB